MPRRGPEFDLIDYLADQSRGTLENGHDLEDPTRVPALTDLSAAEGISIAALREQLSFARALGLVEVRPKTGIRRLPYSFTPAVWESLSYAIKCDRNYFDQFADLRTFIEMNYWNEAVSKLTAEDLDKLDVIYEKAWAKLHQEPIRRPQPEHRDLHMTIFKHIENPFVIGILEAYWNAYEQVGLHRYEGLEYLEKVWKYHRKIIDALRAKQFDKGYKLLVEHMELIDHRPNGMG